MPAIIVIGSNSFSGQDFVDHLLDATDLQIIGVSRSAERPEAFLRYRQNKKAKRFKFFQADMNSDMPGLLEMIDGERPESIVNFAAQSEVGPSWEHPEHWFQTNAVALSVLVNHLRARTYLRRYLHISSPEVYGNCVGRVGEDAPMAPSTPYAASKAAADFLLATYAKQFGFPLLTVRATNVYGARQQLFKIIPRSMIFLKLGKTIELHGGGTAVKSYIHIRDVSRGELSVLERGEVGTLYHLSPDGGISVRDLVGRICARMGKDFAQAVRTVAERPGQDAAYVIDSSRARKEFGWAPKIGIDEGLDDVRDWTERHWDLVKSESLAYQHKA